MNIPQNLHHTKQKGDLAMLLVSTDLVRKEFFVSLPISENCPYDLIVDCGPLLKIQVKYRSDNVLPYKTSWSDANGIHEKVIEDTDFDFFALVSDNYSKIAYCPVAMKGCSIRFERPDAYIPYYWWEDFQDFSLTIPDKRKIADDPDLLSDLRAKQSQQRTGRILSTRRVNRPSTIELTELVLKEPLTSIAARYGVSDVAVKKWCVREKIKVPGRGYWQKTVAPDTGIEPVLKE